MTVGKHWYVVGTLTGLRCEEHTYAPDNAVSGPYKTATIAVAAMNRIRERDKWQYGVAIGVLVFICAFMLGMWLV